MWGNWDNFKVNEAKQEMFGLISHCQISTRRCMQTLQKYYGYPVHFSPLSLSVPTRVPLSAVELFLKFIYKADLPGIFLRLFVFLVLLHKMIEQESCRLESWVSNQCKGAKNFLWVWLLLVLWPLNELVHFMKSANRLYSHTDGVL